MMTDAIAVAEALDSETASGADAARFYVVSKRKFTVLFLSTVGLYAFYWFYKQWSCFKDSTPFDSDEHDIWPFIRAVFAIFFVHSLFRKVKLHSPRGSSLEDWENGAHATFLVVLILVGSLFDRLAGKSIGSPYTDVLSVAMIAPLFFFYYKAQELINISCGDPEGKANSKFTGANYAWIALGAVCWFLVLAGLLLP